MFLAKAGKCPKCGEFLYIHIDDGFPKYYVAKECLSDDCDYTENISDAYNEAMGLKELDRYKKIEYKNSKLVKDVLHKTNVPHIYWNTDDLIKHTIECPKCHMINNFNSTYSIEHKALICECLLCHTEFQLVDIDSQTGIGTSKIIKKDKLDTDIITKGYK